MYAIIAGGFLCDICGDDLMKELPALLESVMESALSNDIDTIWLESGFEKYSALLDSIRPDVSYLGAANQNQGLDDHLGSDIDDKKWRCLIECFCNLGYYFRWMSYCLFAVSQTFVWLFLRQRVNF